MKIKKEFLLEDYSLDEAWGWKWGKDKTKKEGENMVIDDIAMAITNKQYDIIPGLLKKRKKIDPIVLNWAISDSDVKLIDILLKNGVRTTPENIDYAIISQNTDMLPHILKNVTPTSDNLVKAIKSNNDEAVESLLQHNIDTTGRNNLLNMAIISRNVNIINTVLQKVKVVPDNTTMLLVISMNDPEILKALVSHNIIPKKEDYQRASNAKNINDDLLRTFAKYSR